MATQVKHRRGTNQEILAGVPAVGELWYNLDDGSIHMGDGFTKGGIKHATVNMIEQNVETISEMLSLNVFGKVHVAAHHDGYSYGGGTFVWDSNISKSNHDGGIYIDPDRPYPSDWDNVSQRAEWFTKAGDGQGCFVREGYKEQASAILEWFGADPVLSDNTDIINIAIHAALDQDLGVVDVLGRGYEISKFDLRGGRTSGDGVLMRGSEKPTNKVLTNNYTFRSTGLSATDYGITMDGVTNALHNITLNVSGSCGILVERTIWQTEALKNVYVNQGAPASGLIGVDISGVDNSPSVETLVCDFDYVVVRDFDIGFWMRANSNTNTYKTFYALATGAYNPTYGFYVEGQGGVFIRPWVERNMQYSIYTTSTSVSNTFINPWSEGYPAAGDNSVYVRGQSNRIINPYWFIKDYDIGPYCHLEYDRGPAQQGSLYSKYSNNLIENAEIINTDLPGWVGASGSADTVNQILGLNTILVSSPTASTQVHTYTLNDPVLMEKVRGRTLTAVAYGEAINAPTSAQLKILYADGGTQQAAQSNDFLDGEVMLRSCSGFIPETATSVSLRLSATQPALGDSMRVTLPVLFVGKYLSDVAPRSLTDGDSTVHGTLEIANPTGVIPAGILKMQGYYLWVASNGKLRISATRPTDMDTNGTVVGTQS